MPKTGIVVASGLLVVSLGLGGYAWADASDIVPGWITTSPEPVPPAPFITAVPVEPLPFADATASSPLEALLNPSAPLPDAAAIQALAQALNDDPRMNGRTAVSVIDLISGEVLADVNAADPHVPASTTKLLTAIAVVSALGPDYRMATTAYFDPATSTVTLKAGGDMLLAPDAGTGGSNPQVGLTWGGNMPAYGYAGLGDLATQVVDHLASLGVTNVRVVVDTTGYVKPFYPSAWPAYAFSSGYAAPVTGLAVEVGKTQSAEYSPRQSDPAAAAAEIFATRLSERGIAANYVGVGSAAGDQVGLVESAPLSEVAAYMLYASDNTVAEVMTRILAIEQAAASGTGLTASSTGPGAAMSVVEAQLSSLGIPMDSVVLYDGAGFSDQNRIPASTLAGALKVATETEATAEIAGWLAQGALSGTLDERYVGTAAAGLVRAKSGSLTGVAALTGIVITADGRPLLFAAMADSMPYNPTEPRQAIDDFVVQLAQCGCSAQG